MPRLQSVNLIGVLLGAIAMWAVGALWYGLFFDAAWMAGRGYTMEGIEANFQPVLFFAGGLIVPLILTFGIGWVMKRLSITTLARAIMMGLTLALLFAVPMRGYDLVYSELHSVNLFLIDGSHAIVSFMAAAAVLSFFD